MGLKRVLKERDRRLAESIAEALRLEKEKRIRKAETGS